MNNILLDMISLDEGLPPLSHDNTSVLQMIHLLEKREKRKVTRKIKKICKRAISEGVQRVPVVHRSNAKARLEKRLDFKQDDQLFKIRTLSKRISFVRGFLMKKIV